MLPVIFALVVLFQVAQCQAQTPAPAVELRSEIKVGTQVPSVYTWMEALGLVGQGVSWLPSEPRQEYLIGTLAKKDELKRLPEGQTLESILSDDATKVNEFLRARGMSIQLQPLGPKELAAATVLTVADKWTKEGSVTTISTGKGDEKRTYPAVEICAAPNFDAGRNASLFKLEGHGMVVNLYTEGDGSLVYVTPLSDAQLQQIGASDPFAAIKLALALTPKENTPRSAEFTHVKLPMVDLDRTIDVGWLVGLKASDGGRITQALAQFKLKLSQFGFAAKDAVAVARSRGMGPERKPFVIDRPFLFWVTGYQERNLSYPVFAVVVMPESWKDPGTIDELKKK